MGSLNDASNSSYYSTHTFTRWGLWVTKTKVFWFNNSSAVLEAESIFFIIQNGLELTENLLVSVTSLETSDL